MLISYLFMYVNHHLLSVDICTHIAFQIVLCSGLSYKDPNYCNNAVLFVHSLQDLEYTNCLSIAYIHVLMLVLIFIVSYL